MLWCILTFEIKTENVRAHRCSLADKEKKTTYTNPTSYQTPHSSTDTRNHKAKTSRRRGKDKTSPKQSILRITASTLFPSAVGSRQSELSVHDVRRRGREFTPEMACPSPLILPGSSEGCCPARWEAVGEDGGETRKGLCVRGEEGGVRWGEGVRCCCPGLLSCCLETLWPHGSSQVLSDDLTNRTAVTSSVYMGGMRCRFVWVYTCVSLSVRVCVLDCHACVLVAGSYLCSFWLDIQHTPAA